MTREDAGQLVLFLCWRAGVKPCRVDWSTRHVRGCYSPDQRAIKVGPRAWGSVTDQVLHEVAHHIKTERGRKRSGIPKQRAARLRFLRKYPGMRRCTWAPDANGVMRRYGAIKHGPVFVETLKELAALWYGDAKLYPWRTEYRSLRGEGERE